MQSYDPVDRPERELYLRLVSPGARRQLTLVGASGDEGPRDSGMVELLYIDSSHDREGTINEVEAWRPVLGEGSLVVFDDFGHSDYPGVEEAVKYLGLVGEQRHGLFVHRVTAEQTGPFVRRAQHPAQRERLVALEASSCLIARTTKVHVQPTLLLPCDVWCHSGQYSLASRGPAR